ncbi:MAG TPA: amidohydrolase family protein [Gemmatimonadaceae bacterium]|nr:amidohydrolase family protein [Gemmatimonadaceae bacterium]
MINRLLSPLLLLVALSTIGAATAGAQVRRNEQQRPPSMTLEEYDPHSMLVTRETVVRRAKFPFVDIHGHQDLTMPDGELAQLVAHMDAMNMRTMNNLSGGWGAKLAAQVRNARAKYPGRFTVFANIDWSRINEPNFARNAAAQLERDVKEGGAVGLKIFKDDLGLDTRWANGSRVRTDDPRLAPIWDKCGELGIPVLIHTAEPAAFFLPIDAHNERYLELTQYPNRARPSSKYPPFDSLIAEQHRMFKRHARTQFISAHLSWLGQDLGRLGRTMDSIPNMNVEVAAALYEIGRQPRAGRDFFIKYQDRILMGKDTFGGQDEFAVYFRIFESSDEYFPWYRKRHAFWGMYGLALPDSVLQKVYYRNAQRLVRDGVVNGH